MRKLLGLIFAVCFIMSVNGCATVAKDISAEKFADLSKLRSYAWASGSDVNGDTIVSDKELANNIRNKIDEVLSYKRYVKTDAAVADFLVRFHFDVEEKIRVVGEGGGYRGRESWGQESGTAQEFSKCTLVIDMINPDTAGLMWRGSGHAEIYRYTIKWRKLQELREAVVEILDSFPQR